MDDRTIDRVFAGCLVEDLPPVSSKIVRIFTSSTFTDTALERNTLMAEVYPKIKEYCREKHGLEFQVVDMRWGVRDEATDDHMTTELCMREIVNCQRLSMGPNFVVFLGQKYGYRPIPTYILASELTLLKETLQSKGVDPYLLDLWYKKDTNAVPHIFILQPISTILVNFNNKRVPKLQAQDQAIWWDTLTKMQKLLRKAAHTCFLNGSIDETAMHNYFMSVTEREVINGVLNVENTKAHCLAYVRYINNINLQNIKKASNFIDIINRSVDAEAAALLSNLRDERLPNKIETTNIQKYTVEWTGREGIGADTHDEYLTSFLAHFYKNITKLVDRAMRKEDSSAQGVIVTEILQHLHACNNSVKVFYGREEALEHAREYILGPSHRPLILYGQGGCGKTSLLAKIAAMCFEWIKSTPLMILRFLGTTPDSSALTPMLISLCQQISYNFMLPMEDIPDDLVPLTAHFKTLLTYGSVDQPLLVFLDSVDQLTGASGANKLTWLPSKLPRYCKIVISCVYEPDDPDISADYLLLRRIIDNDSKAFIEVTSLGEKLATVVIRRWLEAANRDVSNYQWRVVCNALAECSLPIFVKLVFAEICRWKSYSKAADTVLATNVRESIFKLFERIEIQHGRLLVTHALAYITAAKSGLSETELEDLISLDDKVLDDVYQYHLPPVRRIPPLLWTRIRNDLPNYLSEREADGVSVLSWYHRQFRDAAKERYFANETMAIYFYSSIADYFLGIWGGGNPKPFQYTEIQKHRFGLKDKNAAADRKVPLQPLVYLGKDGKVSRYNLRKFGELPYHLIRSKRFQDLYQNVLFNYQWLHAKISSCPLQSCLSDFEDACAHVQDRESSRETQRRLRREIMLVADALRLGGAILLNHPQMLAPQLVGRLLPEIGSNPNVKRLLDQCDTEGISHCGLIPAYHCMHCPGGPLKYSLEGHQFAVFGFCLTADFRYIISISNKFITWDLSTSDLCRDVNPGIEGILQGLHISPDNRYAAAFSNINQVVLLNMLTNEYVVFDVATSEGDKKGNQHIQGLSITNTHLVVYTSHSLFIYGNVSGTEISCSDSDTPVIETNCQKIELPYALSTQSNRSALLFSKDTSGQGWFLLRMTFRSLDDFDVIYWTGNLDDPRMKLKRFLLDNEYKDGDFVSPESLDFQGALGMDGENDAVCYASVEEEVIRIEFDADQRKWIGQEHFAGSNVKLIQLVVDPNGKYLVGTFMFGYKLWIRDCPGQLPVTLLLPENSGIRNISTKLLESNSCVLSKDDVYAIAGVRKNLYVWDSTNGELLKNLDAHFGRILRVQSLTVGHWNSVITSSIDRTVKVWNINNIFEQVHVIDRHELQIDSISISPVRQIAATVTRNCIGIWDLKTGRMIDKLADSPLGAIVTHAVISKSGRYVLAGESGQVILWESKPNVYGDGMEGFTVIWKQEQDSLKQLMFFDKDSCFASLSKVIAGGGSEMRSHVKVRRTEQLTDSPENQENESTTKISIEDANNEDSNSSKSTDTRLLYEFEYPIRTLRDLTLTSDQSLLVGPGFEKLKDTLFIYNAKTGVLMHKIVLKYSNFKDFLQVLPMPKRATQVALIDADKGNIIDVRTRRFIRSVQKWTTGQVTRDGRYGLYAPGRGGLELIELKHGRTVRTFIPKVAEGVFTIITMFNKTNEFALYYHGGRRTIRIFRTSDANQVGNYRVPAELSSIETTEDGKSVVLGTVDGCLTVLAIADPGKGESTVEYLRNLPSRDPNKISKGLRNGYPPSFFRAAAKVALLAARNSRSRKASADEVSQTSMTSMLSTTDQGVTISTDSQLSRSTTIAEEEANEDKEE